MVIVIHSVTEDCVANVLDYKWLKKHIGEEIHVFNVSYNYDGSISWITIYKDENTVFPIFNYDGLDFTM